jgi:hypothetical protein
MSDERRRSPRYPVTAPVRLGVGEETLPGLLRDICREAALVESPRELPLETPVRLAMELPSIEGMLQVAGRVVRCPPPEGEIHPLAVLFTDVTPAAATRIDLLLARLEGPGRPRAGRSLAREEDALARSRSGNSRI